MIENYNRQNKKYKLGKQEIVDLSIDKIAEILQELPLAPDTEEFNHLSARIFINNYYFIRKDVDNADVYYYYEKIFDLPEKEKLIQIDKSNLKDTISDLAYNIWYHKYNLILDIEILGYLIIFVFFLPSFKKLYMEVSNGK